MSARSLRRASWASALIACALFAAEADSAKAKITVDGWRVDDAGGLLDAPGSRGVDPPIELRARLTDAELAQTVRSPSGPLTVRIDAAIEGSRSRLVLEWYRGGKTVASKGWTLKETARGTVERVSDSPPANSLRLVLVVARGSEARIRTISLRSAGRQVLINPNLVPRGCSPTAKTSANPVGPVEIPHWRRRYSGTRITVRGSAIALNARQLAGVDQYVRAPKGVFRLTVDGAKRGHAYALLEFKRAAAPKPSPQLGVPVAHQDLIPLRFRRGRATVRARTPEARQQLYMGVALIARGPGSSLELTDASLRDQGRQVLRNPRLAPGRCPAGGQRRPAAGTLPPAVRWPLTALLILSVVLLVVRTVKDAGNRPAGNGTEHIFTIALVGVALTALVSVGTLKVGVRVIPADLVLTIAAVGGLVQSELRRVITADPYRCGAVCFTALLVLTGAVGLALASFHTSANLTGLLTRNQLTRDIGQPFSRGVIDEVRLAQGALAFTVLVALLTTRERWERCARVFVLAAGTAALYGVCQVVIQRLVGGFPRLPGAFPYPELLRASSTFPEPTAFGGYAVVAAALAAIVWRLTPSKLLGAALGVLLLGAAMSASSAALLGLLAFVTGVTFSGQRNVRVWIGLLAVVALALTIGLIGIDRATSVVEKPLGSSNSVLDRRVTWSAALHMGSAYAPVGVGRGQFAYNVAPFIEPEDALRSGRAQSALLEIWAEHGPLGLALCIALAAVAGLALLSSGSGLDRVSRRLVWTALATLGAVWVGYYTSSYVWPWVVLALLLTASHALSDSAIRVNAHAPGGGLQL